VRELPQLGWVQVTFDPDVIYLTANEAREVDFGNALNLG